MVFPHIVPCIPDTTSPGTDDLGSSRAETKTVLGCTSRELHPSEDLSELPLFRTGVPTLVLSSQDRSATICFMDGWTRSPPYLPLLCRLPAQVDLRAPSNVAALSLSLQGTPTDVFSLLDILLVRFMKGFFRVPKKFLSLLIQFQKYS